MKATGLRAGKAGRRGDPVSQETCSVAVVRLRAGCTVGQRKRMRAGTASIRLLP